MTEQETNHACPPEVAAGIVAVLKSVRTLKKADSNKHGGYKFASIDAFLEAVGPLCGDAGIFITMDEIDMVVDGGSLTCRFGFGIVHESGATWHHRFARTVGVNAKMGAQAYGAAQSYALKQFLRALFMIPTGDGEDADNHPHHDLPPTRRAPVDPAETARMEIRAEAMALALDLAGGDPKKRVKMLDTARTACNLGDGKVDASGWQCILDRLTELAEQKAEIDAARAGDEFAEEFGGDAPPKLFG